jgi:hypothetical protein
MQIVTRHILFIAALLMTVPAFAGQDILKCTDAEGKVTLTDRPCNGADEASVLVTAADTPPAVQRSPARPYAPGVLLPRRQPSYKPLPPSRIMSRDVATLKAARITMHLLDGPASPMQQQRIAVFP